MLPFYTMISQNTNLSFSEFQSNSEHISLQPLRVEILHAVVMAHQTFAIRLGSWFQKIIGYSGAVAIPAKAILEGKQVVVLFLWCTN